MTEIIPGKLFVEKQADRQASQQIGEQACGQVGKPISKQVKEQVREQTDELAIFRTMFSSSPVGMALLDEQMVLRAINASALAIIGRDSRDVINQYYSQAMCCVHSDNGPRNCSHDRHCPDYAPHQVDKETLRQIAKDALRQGVEDVLHRGRSVSKLEFELALANQGGLIRRWINISIWPIAMNGKKYALAALAEITSDKQKQNTLVRDYSLLQSLVEALPDYIFVKDTESRFIFANDACAKLLHFSSSQELEGKTDFDILPRALAEKHFAKEQKIIKTGQPMRNSELCTEWCGKKHILSCTKVPWRDENGNIIGLVGMNRDISETKQAQRLLEKREQQLRVLVSQLATTEDRERKDIAALLHDDVMQSLAMCKLRLGALAGMVSEVRQANVCEEICRDIGEVISSMRTLSFNLCSPVLYDLGLEAAIKDLLNREVQDGAGLKVDFEDNRQSRRLNDDMRITLFRATRELLTNVIKHARASRVRVSIRNVHNTVRIVVADDGIGPTTVPAKKDDEDTSGGLGLFLIRERLEHLGGGLEFSADPAGGSIATITLPIGDDWSMTEDVGTNAK